MTGGACHFCEATIARRISARSAIPATVTITKAFEDRFGTARPDVIRRVPFLRENGEADRKNREEEGGGRAGGLPGGDGGEGRELPPQLSQTISRPARKAPLSPGRRPPIMVPHLLQYETASPISPRVSVALYRSCGDLPDKFVRGSSSGGASAGRREFLRLHRDAGPSPPGRCVRSGKGLPERKGRRRRGSRACTPPGRFG